VGQRSLRVVEGNREFLLLHRLAPGGADYEGRSGLLYVAVVGSAYIVSRGLAKAGSSEPYWAEPGDFPGGQRGK
jgi:hypothetical protein